MGKKLTNKIATKGLAIQARRTRVAELYLRGGKTYTEIGELFGVSRATISRDLTATKTEWRESRERDTDGHADLATALAIALPHALTSQPTSSNSLTGWGDDEFLARLRARRSGTYRPVRSYPWL